MEDMGLGWGGHVEDIVLGWGGHVEYMGLGGTQCGGYEIGMGR